MIERFSISGFLLASRRAIERRERFKKKDERKQLKIFLSLSINIISKF